jgi:hypothetical protein
LGGERRGEEGSLEGEEEQQESFKNLTYLSAKKSPFLKEKECKAKQRRRDQKTLLLYTMESRKFHRWYY